VIGGIGLRLRGRPHVSGGGDGAEDEAIASTGRANAADSEAAGSGAAPVPIRMIAGREPDRDHHGRGPETRAGAAGRRIGRGGLVRTAPTGRAA